ncbi:hypothetical protein F4774DRAFT_425153 [Daldinia eschscholtzii]|nr:hypothetical protein F4774DRAFT_425153 [Daldinia eschscholtzii]
MFSPAPAIQPVSLMHLYGEEYDEVDRTIQNILNQYVGPPVGSREDAATLLDNLRTTRRQYPGRMGQSESAFFRGFWKVFLVLVKQINSSQPAMDQLILLIQELRFMSLTFPFRTNPWRNLPGLPDAIHNIWHEPTRYEDSYIAFGEWINLNSFAARLYGDGIFDCYGLGITALRRAFESSNTPVPAVRDCRIKAATQWIHWAAFKMFDLMRSVPSHDDRNRHRSDRFTGSRVFSLERWIFWKRHFSREQSDNLDDAIGLALTLMNEADGGMPISEPSRMH